MYYKIGKNITCVFSLVVNLAFSMPNIHSLNICRNFTKLAPKNVLLAMALLLLTATFGCVQKAQREAQLDIESVQPIGSNGVYQIAGSANLPESSQIVVAAVRYLVPTQGQQKGFLKDQANINRSILARQIVEVKEGKWQAELNLWKVAPDGKYHEVWQANQAQTKLRPDSSVTFVVTFEPAAQLEKSNLRLDGKQLRFTNESEAYLQASETFTVSLPVGKTAPPLQTDDELAMVNPTQASVLTSSAPFLPTAKLRQTNAPLKPSEFLR